MTTNQAREAVRAINLTTIGGKLTHNRKTLYFVYDYSDKSKPPIGKGDTQHRAWLDALANLSRPRLYVEPEVAAAGL